MVLNKFTGPGKLTLKVLTEANVRYKHILHFIKFILYTEFPFQLYLVGEEDVPHLVTPKLDILSVSPHISYKYVLADKNLSEIYQKIERKV